MKIHSLLFAGAIAFGTLNLSAVTRIIIKKKPNPRYIIHAIQTKKIKVSDKLDKLTIAIPSNIVSYWNLTRPTCTSITRSNNSVIADAQYRDGSLKVTITRHEIRVDYTNWQRKSNSQIIRLSNPVRNFKAAQVEWGRYIAGVNHVVIMVPK